MKQLKDIIYKVNLEEVLGPTDIPIGQVVFDSRKVRENDLFVAIPGTQVDGHDYIEQAIEKGAKAVLCETLPFDITEAITYLVVPSSARALAIVAANYYDNPSEKLKLVGVTGTNGKTTVATLSYKLFRHMKKHAGLLSTVNNLINDRQLSATHTTPDALQINELLAQMVEEGCEYCFMEVSSHALDQERVHGLHFDVAVFTNITHDHLDYHKTFDNYIAAKKKLFDNLTRDAVALTNLDDKRAKVMVQNTKARVRTFSIRMLADYKAKILENTFAGLVMDIDGQEVYSRLIGDFNASNLLAVYSIARSLDVEQLEALSALSALKTAEGRFDYFFSPNDSIVGIIDYAHTPDALKKVLQTLNQIRTGNEELISVVGCGGDRDTAKRTIMAQVACELSTKVVFTSDNPRSEDPQAIIDDMLEGLNPNQKKKALTVVDRKEAIRTAGMLAQPKDIILVAGKGHEKYQEINGVKHPFDDKAVLTETLKSLGK